jgi:hypothetical protein
MELLDATSLADRLKWEAKEYWLHLEAETPFEKYPGELSHCAQQEDLVLITLQQSNMQDACRRSWVSRKA